MLGGVVDHAVPPHLLGLPLDASDRNILGKVYDFTEQHAVAAQLCGLIN
jgi:hypothetical protein